VAAEAAIPPPIRATAPDDHSRRSFNMDLHRLRRRRSFKPAADVEGLPLLLPRGRRLDGLATEWTRCARPSSVGPLRPVVQSFFFVPPSKLPAATKPVQNPC